MLPKIASFVMGFGLAGCSLTAESPTPVANPHCARVADQRAQDAADNGIGPNTQRAIWDRTYKDCVSSYSPVALIRSKTH